MRHAAIALIPALLALAAPGRAAEPAKGDPAAAAQALDILKRSIGFRTVQGGDQFQPYAAYLTSVLTAGGFAPGDVTVTPMLGAATLVARWPGSDPKLKPLVISCHMDVVEANPKDWTRDPFTAVVEDGYVFGRGALDDKFGVSTALAALAQLHREGFRPARTIVLALSGDEETDMATTRALAKQLAGAELALNGDGGGGLLDEKTGKPMVFGLQAGEKTYADFEISFLSPGGHSSRPGPARDNAIYRLAQAIDRIAAYQFPPQSNELTRAFFAASAMKTPGPLGEAMKRYAADPADQAAAETLSANQEYVGQVRTTCVATMLKGGHALNALPQAASVDVNCRIFPGVAIETIRAKLAELAGPEAKITTLGSPSASDASPLRPDVVAAVKQAVAAIAPGVPVVPIMSSGASDGLYFRGAGVPTYGIGPVFLKASDDFSHGLNERVPVASIAPAVVEWTILLRRLAG